MNIGWMFVPNVWTADLGSVGGSAEAVEDHSWPLLSAKSKKNEATFDIDLPQLDNRRLGYNINILVLEFNIKNMKS